MRMTQTACLFAAAVALTSYSASAQEEHRQLGAHVHGHGRLNIAVEGKTVSMELEVPGADIVGFEHEPSTPEQRSQVDEARARLANALVLFVPTEKAGCELDRVKVSTTAHEHEGEEAHHPAAAGPEGAAKEEGEHHSEFHAEYTLQCSSLSRLTSMNFEYFNAFPGAQELDITLISPKGQSSFEVKRDSSSLDLTGKM
ncbi:MAG: DUF2796 domain-containing protein [Rhodomicrobium sp.]